MISNHWKKCYTCAGKLLGDPSMDIRDRKIPKTIYPPDSIACEDCGGLLVDIYTIWKYCDACRVTWPHIYEICPKCRGKTRWLPILTEENQTHG